MSNDRKTSAALLLLPMQEWQHSRTRMNLRRLLESPKCPRKWSRNLGLDTCDTLHGQSCRNDIGKALQLCFAKHTPSLTCPQFYCKVMYFQQFLTVFPSLIALHVSCTCFFTLCSHMPKPYKLSLSRTCSTKRKQIRYGALCKICPADSMLNPKANLAGSTAAA